MLIHTYIGTSRCRRLASNSEAGARIKRPPALGNDSGFRNGTASLTQASKSRSIDDLIARSPATRFLTFPPGCRSEKSFAHARTKSSSSETSHVQACSRMLSLVPLLQWAPTQIPTRCGHFTGHRGAIVVRQLMAFHSLGASGET